MQSHYTTTTIKLVPPRRIERHPPALQAGAQTTYAREAMIVGNPRENRIPTKRFGNSCAATTPAGITLWWAPLESNQECLPQGTGVTARWCIRHSTKTPIDCWSGWLGLNQRPPRPKRGALPTAPHPDWKRERESNPLSPAYETGMIVRFTPPLRLHCSDSLSMYRGIAE